MTVSFPWSGPWSPRVPGRPPLRPLAAVVLAVALVGCADSGGTNGTDSTAPKGSDTTVPVDPTNGAPTPTTPAWTRVDPPRVVGSTDAVVTGASGLGDGTYWAVLDARPTGSTATFTVMRAHFGAACEAYVATVRGVQCMSGYTVQREPRATVALAPDAAVSVAALDDPSASYAVGPGDLLGLAGGKATSLAAGYAWAPFPFIVEVRAGRAVVARQFWIP